jgi:cell division GTPase FtsZ
MDVQVGAAVDPKMEGRIKITVIATGFDRARVAVSPASPSTLPTPVDLTAYSSRLQMEERMPTAVASPWRAGR